MLSDMKTTLPTALVSPARDTDYSIWSMAYCQADMPYDFFGGAGLFSNKGMLKIPMLYTLLVGGEVGGKKHVALVDCGFKQKKWLQRYAFSGWEDPSTVLERVGYSPADVETILVTHMHFDHMGNFEAFPNAKLYVQLDEYVGWVQAVSLARELGEKEETSWIFSSFDPDDLVRASSGIVDGRLRFIHGDVEVLPGITAHLAKDSHTFGTQWFWVRTRNGPYAIVGDTVYWYSNVEANWPPGYHQGNAFNQIYTYRTLRNVVQGETKRIIPGHDPLIWERHPTWIPREINQVAEVNLAQQDPSRNPKKRSVAGR
jgi:glyoxylase-like metal-dependent hydrolase (beta-lactamase superfamily II)